MNDMETQTKNVTKDKKRAIRIRYHLELMGRTVGSVADEIGMGRQWFSAAINGKAYGVKRVRDALIRVTGIDFWEGE